MLHLPWVLTGDLNLTRFSHERKERSYSTSAVLTIDNFIRNVSHIDVPVGAGEYTLSNNWRILVLFS